MPNVISHDGRSNSKTISGTLTLLISGPPRDPKAYNGDVQGVYTRQDTSYRWIYDEPRSGGSGPRLTFVAR